MSDAETFLPQLSNCPYCGQRLDGEQYVDVVDETEMCEVTARCGIELNKETTYDTTRCIRFLPCGHAFEKESVDVIIDALLQLRRLKHERRRCEDADRLQELDYELEAQTHAINNRVAEAARRENAELVEE